MPRSVLAPPVLSTTSLRQVSQHPSLWHQPLAMVDDVSQAPKCFLTFSTTFEEGSN